MYSWKIAEQEKQMRVLEEKELGFMIKTNTVKQKYDDLKKTSAGKGSSPKKVDRV